MADIDGELPQCASEATIATVMASQEVLDYDRQKDILE